LCVCWVCWLVLYCAARSMLGIAGCWGGEVTGWRTATTGSMQVIVRPDVSDKGLRTVTLVRSKVRVLWRTDFEKGMFRSTFVVAMRQYLNISAIQSPFPITSLIVFEVPLIDDV
jgi:hypothetical protein